MKLSTKIIFPIAFGIFFYIFLLLGSNAELISKNKTLTLISIILGAILLYIIIFGILKDIKNLSYGLGGFFIAQILFSIGIPIFLIIYKIYFVDYNKKEPQSILEKENIQFLIDNKESYKIKYGSFVKGCDTIIRYSKDSLDYELIQSFGKEKLNQIKWLDSCTYYRINSQNNSITDLVKIGNFKGQNHFLYTKPAVTHKMEDEKVELTYQIKNRLAPKQIDNL